MLGIESLEQKLRESDGKQAPATVRAAKAGIYTTMNGDSHGWGGTDITRWHYTLDVEPENEPAFEAKVVIRINKLGTSLAEGSKTVVLYDPADHSRVAFDLEATKQAIAEGWERRYTFNDDETPEPAPAPPPPPPPPPNPEEHKLAELQKLADLHDRGVLTDTEFTAEKTKLLSA